MRRSWFSTSSAASWTEPKFLVAREMSSAKFSNRFATEGFSTEGFSYRFFLCFVSLWVFPMGFSSGFCSVIRFGQTRTPKK